MPLSNLSNREIDECLRIANLRIYLAFELLKTYGSSEMIRRYALGTLDEQEMIPLARTVLFESFESIEGAKRYGKARDLVRVYREFQHADRCPERGKNDERIVESKAPAPLPSGHWGSALEQTKLHPWLARGLMVDASKEPVAMTCDRVTVSCEICKSECVLIVVRVAMQWSGVELAREWLIDQAWKIAP